MKKVSSFIFILALCVSLVGCSLFEMKIEEKKWATVTANEIKGRYFKATVHIPEGYSLTVNDTTSLTVGKNYFVNYALADKEGNLYDLEIEMTIQAGLRETPFVGRETFTVESQHVMLSFYDKLEAGEYFLVAYIATMDGVRATDYVLVEFAEITANFGENVSMGENGELKVVFEQEDDIHVNCKIDKKLTYQELYDLMEAEAYVYGDISDAKIEKATVDEATNSVVYVPLSGDETEIDVGSYRTTFTKENKTAYIYLHLYRTV